VSPTGEEKPYCRADCKWRARIDARVSRSGFRTRFGTAVESRWRAALLFGGRDVNQGGRTENDHELLIAAARAVLVSLREPIEQRALPRAALGALRMLEAALDGAGRGTRR